jgi:acyl-[acyl-carrier-protein]-phospholipid O-acyltransferase/long-chain-fatty-acid--[acyl-carrier-protein] ligase
MIKILRPLLRLLFRIRAFNVEALRTPGPVLLLPNHTSWWDWLLLGVFLEDDWRFVVSATTAQTSWFHRKIMINRRTFPVENDSPYAVKHMAEYLQKGGRLVLFPEGRMSPTGCLMKLFDGTGFLIHKTRAKVVIAYLRGANRLRPAVQPGYTQWLPRITVHFSQVLTAPDPGHVSTAIARSKLTNWVRDQMMRLQFDTEMAQGPASITAAIAARVRERPGFNAVEDITWKPMSYRRLFMSAGLLAQQWRTRLPQGAAGPQASPVSGGASLASEPERIGVLLPNAIAMPVTLLSLWASNRVPAILNYTTGPGTMLSCIRVANLKQVVTSRAFLKKARLDIQPLEEAGVKFQYLEDVRSGIGAPAKLAAVLRSWLCPASPLRAEHEPDETAVVLFTSGSEGVPKGVELSHRNILANIRQMLVMSDLQISDRFFTALPVFHSFGLTAGTLLPLASGAYALLYPSPLHYRIVPTVFYDRNCTVLLSTNTFLSGYARKAQPYDFRSLRYLFAAAEKVQEVTVRTWSERFGIRVLEGYGATECGPCVSFNTPLNPHSGTAGELLPGMEWRVEPVEGVSYGSDGGADTASSGDKEGGTLPGGRTPDHIAPAAIPRTGRLFVRGPNVMKGYINPEANAKFKALDGWYDTGDIVHVDEGNFIRILGRLKRFAKISGEMISLTSVEEALAGAFPQFGLRFAVAVVAVPDEEKGERLIAVTNEARLSLDEIRAAIKARGLSNLAVPREVRFVREIPKLGTGKVNHRELDKLFRPS